MGVSYETVADDISHEQEGLEQSALERISRDSVRELCKSLNVLNRKDTFDFVKDKVYELQHPGDSFSSMIGVWVDKEDAYHRLDDNYISDLSIGENETKFQLPRVKSAKKIITAWSWMPRLDSGEFPALLWEQYAEIIRYGALKRMRTYLRKTKRGHMPNFEALWHEKMRTARHRLQPTPGPEHTLPWWGGENDIYSTNGYD